MSESLSIGCPHCGETFFLACDESEGSSEFIVDCEICCRPMSVAIKMTGGEIEGVQVTEC